MSTCPAWRGLRVGARNDAPTATIHAAIDPHIYGLAFDRARDCLWACTWRGVRCFNIVRETWSTGMVLDGLPHPTVYHVSVDDATGAVWFATVDGLGCLALDGRWTVYRADPRPIPTAIRAAAVSLGESRFEQIRHLPVRHRRLVRLAGFRLSQPGQRFIADSGQYGRSGVPAEVLAKLLGEAD